MQKLFRSLIFLNQLNMFRATNSPILRRTFRVHIQLLVQCTDTAAHRCLRHRSAAVSVHCTKSCICSLKVLLRMGEFVARNMLSWFKKINERKKLLHLVGCLQCCTDDAWSHKHQFRGCFKCFYVLVCFTLSSSRLVQWALHNEDSLLPGSGHPVTRRRIPEERNLSCTVAKTSEVAVIYNACGTAELCQDLQTLQL